MQLTVKWQDIAGILELRKKKAECEFKIGYLTYKGSDSDESIKEISAELNEVSNSLEKLEKKFEPLLDSIVLPNETKLYILNEKLQEKEDGEIFTAMRIKDGEIYSLLKERGHIIKHIFEKRSEIAKLNVLLLGMDDEKKEELKGIIMNGSCLEKEHLEGQEEGKKKRIVQLFGRISLPVEKELMQEEEIEIPVGSTFVWVPKEKFENYGDEVKNFTVLSQKIQFFNAKRQIKQFDENEEKQFSKLQQDYLNALKAKDEILRENDTESKEFTITLTV
ncbi:hypothetical protein JXB01_04010 [Candidatus Micrarchaeota archaeon]|nr:hypothetical protein [Candidatus Micrarchaeota archaeon]